MLSLNFLKVNIRCILFLQLVSIWNARRCRTLSIHLPQSPKPNGGLVLLLPHAPRIQNGGLAAISTQRGSRCSLANVCSVPVLTSLMSGGGVGKAAVEGCQQCECERSSRVSVPPIPISTPAGLSSRTHEEQRFRKPSQTRLSSTCDSQRVTASNAAADLRKNRSSNATGSPTKTKKRQRKASQMWNGSGYGGVSCAIECDRRSANGLCGATRRQSERTWSGSGRRGSTPSSKEISSAVTILLLSLLHTLIYLPISVGTISYRMIPLDLMPFVMSVTNTFHGLSILDKVPHCIV